MARFCFPGRKKPGGISIFYVLVKQMKYRWAVALLLWAALCGVVALYTYVSNSARFHERSMQLIMKDMGHNLWFISASGTSFDTATGSDQQVLFSRNRIYDLAEDKGIASTYWGNVLQQTHTIRGSTVLLTGLEVLDDFQVTEEKAHLLEPLMDGEAALGSAIALEWQFERGDLMAIGENEYIVTDVHRPRGNIDDRRLWLPLADVQELLDTPGSVNLILGFLCMRGLPLTESLEGLERRVSEKYPDMQVVPLMNLLNARSLARMTTSRYLYYLAIFLLVVTVLLIAGIGWMEVRERRYELAVMFAMGAGYSFVLWLFLAKLALLAVAASLAGFLIGSYMSVYWLSPVLVTHTMDVVFTWQDFPGIFSMTLLLVAVAAVFPIINLMRLEPARILAEE